MNVRVSDEALRAIENFQLPKDLTFGKVLAPVMIEAYYSDGEWSEMSLVPYRKLELDPTCKVLHYAQEIFEGLKAYYCDKKGPYLFRPEINAERFNLSAERMAMPALPAGFFVDGVKCLTKFCTHLIPTQSGDSLYIRPFMFATDNHLGIKPSGTFHFMILASPSEAYFSSESISVQIERSAVRACPGGVGTAKTGGNYAASLLSMLEARRNGFDQVLWLDALNKESIEELSGMNFFAVYRDGNNSKLVTPKLTETILDGITRKSIISLAAKLGHKVEEVSLNINQLCEDIISGQCLECFACGTAVIITPIKELGDLQGNRYELQNPYGQTTKKIRKALLNIQEGFSDDPFLWRIKV